MHRLQNGRLTGRGHAFPPDPDWVLDELDALVLGRTFDASLIQPVWPERILANRLSMKMQLARYARIDPWTWEHRDVTEMRAHHAALVEMLRGESSATPEDR